MSEQDFLADESRILGAMQERGKKALETGLVCKLPQQGEVQAGYIVYLTHSFEPTDGITAYSRQIAQALKGRTVPYGRNFDNVHTTVGTYNIQTRPSNQEVPRSEKLDTLCRLSNAAQETITDLRNKASFLCLHGPVLEYLGLIHDEGTVVAKPETFGVRDFYELEEILAQKASQKGIQIKKSWGRHITVARVTQDIPPEELEEFKEFMEQPKPIQSFSDALHFEPVSLNVGYFRLQNGNHECDRRFSLKPFSAFFFD